MNWVDLGVATSEQEAERRAFEAISLEDKKVMLAALTAKSFQELGDSGHRRTRERQGKKKLIAANDNYASHLKKLSS